MDGGEISSTSKTVLASVTEGFVFSVEGEIARARSMLIATIWSWMWTWVSKFFAMCPSRYFETDLSRCTVFVRAMGVLGVDHKSVNKYDVFVTFAASDVEFLAVLEADHDVHLTVDSFEDTFCQPAKIWAWLNLMSVRVLIKVVLSVDFW